MNRLPLVTVVVLLLGSAAPGQEVVARIRFEGQPQQALSEVADGKVLPKEARLTDDIPGPFICDPLSGQALANATALRITPGQRLEWQLREFAENLGGDSFTVEMFVRPEQPWRGPIFIVEADNAKDRAACGLQPVFFPQFGNQYYYGGFVQLPGTKKEHVTTGEYGSVSMLRGDQHPWRHVALVYDAKAQIISWHTDYFMSRQHKLDRPPRWGTNWYLAGTPRQADFAGAIDEVRLTRGALAPHQFLRARSTPLAKVDFSSPDSALPAAANIVNIKAHFGAVGDGVTDDTQAILAAFRTLQARHAPGGAHVLFFPKGTYLISDTVQWSRFLTVQGAGKEETTIRLQDNCPGFTDPAQPKPAVVASSTPGPPGSEKAVNGSSINNWLMNMTIDTGTGNRGARALEFHSNNVGAVENVRLISRDGTGAVGLDLTRRDCGPALYKNLEIVGYDIGVSIRIRSQEYSHTFVNLNLRGQRVAGLENWGNIIALHGVRSENRVPAIVCTGGNTMLTVLDGEFTGGDSAQPALRAAGGIYLRNVRAAGYKEVLEQTIEERDGQKIVDRELRSVPGPRIDEFVGSPIVCPRGEATGSLKLPVQSPPETPMPIAAAQWVNVSDFKTPTNDWAAATEAAFATGKPFISFARGGVTLSRSVAVPGSVRRIYLASGGIGLAKEAGDRPAFIIAGGSDPLVIEHGDVRLIEHASPRTLILRHGGFNYRAVAGAGNLFMEDVGGSQYHFVKGQRIWAWQWNVEAHGAGPCITNEGAHLWVLGFKTEYESEKIHASAGAATEILGAFIYPLGKIPADRPIFRNENSRLAIVYGTSVYQANHKLHILDSTGTDRHEIGNDRLRWIGSRARMDLYVSHP